jgi:hypothetical protein
MFPQLYQLHYPGHVSGGVVSFFIEGSDVYAHYSAKCEKTGTPYTVTIYPTGMIPITLSDSRYKMDLVTARAVWKELVGVGFVRTKEIHYA